MPILAHAVSFELAPPRLVCASHAGFSLLVDAYGSGPRGLRFRTATGSQNVPDDDENGNAYACLKREEAQQHEERDDKGQSECNDECLDVEAQPINPSAGEW